MGRAETYQCHCLTFLYFNRQDFEAFDLNKDGVISREEWEAVRAGSVDESDKRQLTWDEVRAFDRMYRVGY